MQSADFRVIIKNGLLYTFRSGGLFGGKSASLWHISGWDRVSSTSMSRLRELDRETEELRMSNIVGTIITVDSFLSKTEVSLKVKPENNNSNDITLVADREYRIPLFQREIRWNTNNINILLSDLCQGHRFLGNIILSIGSDNIKCEIIDGQQRTTILMMIIESIRTIHGTKIELPNLCPIINESFEGFQKILTVGFDESKIPSNELVDILKKDAYKQYEKIKSLWNALCQSEIILDKYSASNLIDNLKRSEFNIIASHSDKESESIKYFLDVNLKGVQLDTEDIFKGYLFSQDSSPDSRKLWQDIKQLNIIFNKAKDNMGKDKYPLMKMYEHFFYCDLYLSSDTYNNIKFNEDFTLKSQFNVGRTTFFKGTHLIEVIRDRDYFENSLKRIKKCLEIMNDIVTSETPSDYFKSQFKSKSKIDSISKSNCYIMLQKILLDKEVVPKILATKYILSFFDGCEHGEKDYKSIFSVFASTVIFTIFAPKKEGERFYNIVSAKDWVHQLNKWLKKYVFSENLSKGKLLAPYKYSEDEELCETQSYRCKSLAAITNYVKIDSNDNLKAIDGGAFNDFFKNTKENSVEHFIIGNEGTLEIKNKNIEFNYEYPSSIKRYRHSLFNYIFINRDDNGAIGNSIIGQKYKTLANGIKNINCDYSKMYLNLISQTDKFFLKYPTEKTILEFKTEDEAKKYLDDYFNNDFPVEFLNFAKELVNCIKILEA